MNNDEINEVVHRIFEISEYICYKDDEIPNKLKKIKKKIRKDGIESIIEGDNEDE